MLSGDKDLLNEGLAEKYIESSWLEGVVTPQYGRYSIVEVAGTIYSSLGANVTAPYCDLIDRVSLADCNKIAFIVVDALGYYQLIKMGGETLDELLEMGVEVYPVTSVAPSTTATAIASLTSAQYPGEHGVLGYKLWIKELGSVVKVLGMKPAVGGFRDQLKEAARKPSEIFDVKTPFTKLLMEGVKIYSYIPASVKDTEFTKLVYSGVENKSIVSLGDFSVKVSKALREKGRVLVTAYLPSLDNVLHENSPDSEEYEAELWHILKALKRVFEAAKKEGAAVVVVSDHGGVPVSSENVVWLDKLEGFVELITIPPTGEKRMRYIYTRDPDKLRELLRDKNIAIVESRVASEKGLFGPRMNHSSKVGDVIAIAKGYECLEYPYLASDEEFTMKGAHGGLTPQEMIVPLMFYAGKR